MRRILLPLGILAVLALPQVSGAEDKPEKTEKIDKPDKIEKIRGLLEKTVKPGACAQITDALSEIYYVTKTDEATKLVEKYLGKDEKVVITGIVESKEGDPSYFFNLKSVEPYTPKLPPAPSASAPAENKDKAETKTDKPAEIPAPEAPKK